MLRELHEAYSIAKRKYISHKLLSESDVVFEISYQLRSRLSKQNQIRLNAFVKTGRRKHNFPDISVWRGDKCIMIIEVKEKPCLTIAQWRSEKSRMTTYMKTDRVNKAANFMACIFLLSQRRPQFSISHDNVDLTIVEAVVNNRKKFKKWLSDFKKFSKPRHKKRKV